MPSTEINLIEELLHNAQAAGGKPLERRLADMTIWFYKNKDRIPRDNLAGRQAFLEKAFWIQLELNALLIERLRERSGKSRLWQINGVSASGDMKNFG